MSKNIGNTIYDRSINYYETDQMGIVHHSNYIRYFEEARLDMMEQVGLSYAAMEEHGLIIPVLSVACEYIKPVLFGEKVQIHTRLVKFDGIKMQFVYEIYCEGELRTKGNEAGPHEAAVPGDLSANERTCDYGNRQIGLALSVWRYLMV